MASIGHIAVGIAAARGRVRLGMVLGVAMVIRRWS